MSELKKNIENQVSSKEYRGWEKLEHETQMRFKAWSIEQGIYHAPLLMLMIMYFGYGLAVESTLNYGESFGFFGKGFWFLFFIGGIANILSLKYAKPIISEVMEKQNKEISEDVYIKGAKFVTSRIFNTHIREYQKEEFEISRDKNVFDSFKIPIQKLNKNDKRYENEDLIDTEIEIPFISLATGLCIMGSPGRGKSVLINRMLSQIQNNNNTKSIIIDVKGEFVEKFYNAETDYILCPSDLRSVRFDLYKLIRTRVDAGAVADILIPDDKQTQDPHWTAAARALMEGVLIYASKNKTSNKEIYELISEPAKLATIKEDDEIMLIVGNYLRVGEDGIPDKETASILSSLARKAKTLQYLKYLDDLENNDLIEFNKWLFDGKGGKLFLLATENLSKVFSPLYGVITSYIISSVLDAEDDRNRNIYLILDELPRLGKALGENLEKALAVGRSKGLKTVMAMQSYSQIKKEFGEKEAETILDTTNSYVVFQSNIGAQFLEKHFGKSTVLRNDESFSFGMDNMSDRVTISRKEVKEALIDDSEINRLTKFEFYAKIEGCTDVLKSKLAAKFIDGNKVVKYIENPKLTIQNVEKEHKELISRIKNNFVDTLNVLEVAKNHKKSVIFDF